eukprot:GFUD01094658.1.p1 GENE.GFUD01094658.1~~GFUD01094658.1.p1  ORF type:complete len:113 (+),score=58.35 GFUD01094658.1:299-637(+)
MEESEEASGKLEEVEVRNGFIEDEAEKETNAKENSKETEVEEVKPEPYKFGLIKTDAEENSKETDEVNIKPEPYKLWPKETEAEIKIESIEEKEETIEDQVGVEVKTTKDVG